MRPADLTLLELLVNGKAVDALARLVPTSECCTAALLLAAAVVVAFFHCRHGSEAVLLVDTCPPLSLPSLTTTFACTHTHTHTPVLQHNTSSNPFVAGDATRVGRTLAARLKELLDRQQYEVIIQVGAGGLVGGCASAGPREGGGREQAWREGRLDLI